jgi:hypothetical protein
MKLNIEMEAEDAVELCIFHNDMLSLVEGKIPVDLFETLKKATELFVTEVGTRISNEEFESIKNKLESEKFDPIMIHLQVKPRMIWLKRK